jgi:hypothetical protein
MKLQNYIIKNYGKITNKEIAENRKIDVRKLAGQITALKRKGLLSGEAKAEVKGKKVNHKLPNTVTNTYSNANGKNKETARNKMVTGVHESGLTGTILTLPHVACTIEKKILTNNNGYNFIGCELDKTTYNGMRQTIRRERLPIEPHHGKISDMIYGVEENTYAHLILDYCGTIPTFAKEIQYAINNDIVKVGGTIAVTVTKRGNSDPNNVVKKLANITTNNTKDERGEVEKGIEAFFHKVTGWNYIIQEFFTYQDKGKAPMMLIRIKRVK